MPLPAYLILAAAVPSSTPQAPRFHWADYDGDGRVDVLVVAPEGGVSLLRNLGNAEFEDVTLGSGLAALGDEAHQGAWADYDGDGLLDLFLASYTGRSRLLRQNGSRVFEEVFPPTPRSDAGAGPRREVVRLRRGRTLRPAADHLGGIVRAGARRWRLP